MDVAVTELCVEHIPINLGCKSLQLMSFGEVFRLSSENFNEPVRG